MTQTHRGKRKMRGPFTSMFGMNGRTLLAAALAVAPVIATAATGDAWPIYGGDAANTRHSTLKQINTGNVSTLKVSWIRALGSLESQESSPLVIGDTMYVTSSSGPRYVFALNARDGAIKWVYEPEVPSDFSQYACCGIGNRGVAYENGRIFVGRMDGKLAALDAATGKELWTTTVANYKEGSGITSPPMLIKGLVITGYAGGEYGVRGAIQAYNQADGKLVWKTWTTPGPGEPGSETWKGDSAKNGGGTAWYVGSYDAKANILYYGLGNAGPWGNAPRGNNSPDIGPYTNLYTASTVALNPETGKIVWHYQETPADVWDYDGVNEKILVDLKIDGKEVPALMTASRNGFIYVLNRQTGKLISANPFVEVNWASRVDLATGRPVENPEKRPLLNKWAKDVCPSVFGGKEWMPMSYSPVTGLVYIPAIEACMNIMNKEEEKVPGKFYLGTDMQMDPVAARPHQGRLMAWDPIAQKQVWTVNEDLPLLGGTMNTDGGLVFYGNVKGMLHALDSKTGKQLWKFNVGTGMTQSPITYMIDGKQYVAVVAGRIKGPPSFMGKKGEAVINASPEGGQLVVFELPGR